MIRAARVGARVMQYKSDMSSTKARAAGVTVQRPTRRLKLETVRGVRELVRNQTPKTNRRGGA